MMKSDAAVGGGHEGDAAGAARETARPASTEAVFGAAAGPAREAAPPAAAEIAVAAAPAPRAATKAVAKVFGPSPPAAPKAAVAKESASPAPRRGPKAVAKFALPPLCPQRFQRPWQEPPQ